MLKLVGKIVRIWRRVNAKIGGKLFKIWRQINAKMGWKSNQN